MGVSQELHRSLDSHPIVQPEEGENAESKRHFLGQKIEENTECQNVQFFKRPLETGTTCLLGGVATILSH